MNVWGTGDSQQRVALLEDNAMRCLEEIKRQLAPPGEDYRSPRTWGSAEVTNMLGKSRTAVNAAERALGLEVGRDANKRRRFTLEVINTLRQHWGQLPSWESAHAAPIVMVGNHKGGVSKSSIAVHFAKYCALQGLKVLVADLDAQATLTSYFYALPNEEFEAHETVSELFHNAEAKASDLIIETHWNGLDLLPGNLDLGHADSNLLLEAYVALKGGGPEAAKFQGENDLLLRVLKGLKDVRGFYDVIVLDTAPSLSISVIASLLAADFLFVPLKPSMLDLSSTREYFATLNDVANGEKIPNRFAAERLIFTQGKTTRVSDATVRKIVRHAFPGLVLEAEFKDSDEIKSAADSLSSIYDLQRPIGRTDSHRRARRIADDVCREMLRTVFPSFPSLEVIK